MKKLASFLILILGLGSLLFFRDSISELYLSFVPRPSDIKQEAPALVQELKERVSAPAPLIVEVRLPHSFLTYSGVVQWTNVQRNRHGLPALKENPQLNFSATLKVQDMLEKQYFAHVSPSGQGVSDLASVAGYELISIGENLALGDFEDDEKLLESWMASPGHRENILNPQYQELGVAVVKGEYLGRETWLAVQHFGKPLSSCPQASEKIAAEISTNQRQIEELHFTLSELQSEIETMRPKRGPAYNQKVEQYNELVLEYNGLIDQTKILIEQYNAQVKLFNQCATSVQ